MHCLVLLLCALFSTRNLGSAATWNNLGTSGGPDTSQGAAVRYSSLDGKMMMVVGGIGAAGPNKGIMSGIIYNHIQETKRTE